MNNSSTDTLEDATCSFAVSTALTSAISLLSIGSFVGNCLVTITFLMNASLRTSTNYFIINIAVSDILSSSANWPVYATEGEGIIIRKPMIEGSVATKVCKLGHYFRAVSLAVSVLSLLLVVVDRYIAIVLPFKAIYVRTRLRAALLMFAWTLSLLIFIPYASSSEIIQKGHQTFCRTFASWNKIEKYVVFTVGFFIFYCVPLFSIIVLYSRIMKSLRQTSPGGEGQENVRIRKLH